MNYILASEKEQLSTAMQDAERAKEAKVKVVALEIVLTAYFQRHFALSGRASKSDPKPPPGYWTVEEFVSINSTALLSLSPYVLVQNNKPNLSFDFLGLPLMEPSSGYLVALSPSVVMEIPDVDFDQKLLSFEHKWHIQLFIHQCNLWKETFFDTQRPPVKLILRINITGVPIFGVLNFWIAVMSCKQNGVIERRNCTLIEAARTMLIYAQAPLFLWGEAMATACFTQNRSIIRLRHGKTLYELMHGKQPDLSFFHVFGALCYPTNDSENVDKLQPKADIRIFIGYAPTKKAFRIYNRLTRRIVETINVDFDELTAMAFEQSSSGPALNEMIPVTISSGLVQKSSSSTSYVPPSRNDWDLLFRPLFDELLNPPPSVCNQATEVIAPITEVIPQVDDDLTGSPSSTIVDQEAPLPSKSSTPTETQSSAILQDVGNVIWI
nr:hypothetical protein [Tanacetum cinerariifolium]